MKLFWEKCEFIIYFPLRCVGFRKFKILSATALRPVTILIYNSRLDR